MRKYYDLIVLDKKLIEKLKLLGFEGTFSDKIKIITENPKKTDPKKINLFFPKSKKEIIKVTKHYKKYIYGFLNPIEKEMITPSMIRLIKESDMSIVLSLDYLVNYKNKHQLFRNLTFLGKLVIKYKINLIITTCAKSIYEIKSPRQLASIGQFLCLNQMQCLNTISNNVEYLVDIYEGNI